MNWKCLKKIGDCFENFREIKLLKRKINNTHYMYFILCVVNPKLYMYMALLIVGTIISTPTLFKLKKEYSIFDYIGKTKAFLLVIVYYLGCIISVIVYGFNPLLAILVLSAGRLPQYLFDNMFARKTYKGIM